MIPAQIKFLGTGAADFDHYKTCSCANCKQIQQLGGRNLRKSSSVLLDQQILIDCGPHTFDALKKYDVKIGNIEHLFFTHSHSDHMSAIKIDELITARSEKPFLSVYAHATVLQQLPGSIKNKINLIPLEPETPVQVCDWSIEGLKANHYISDNPREQPFHYLFTRDDNQWLYATDGSWLLKETWIRLQRSKLNAVVFDNTLGELKRDPRMFEHNTLIMIEEMVGAFRNAEILCNDAKIILTHMSIHVNPPHDLWTSKISARGFILAYDGLELPL